ncbi:MAG: hypothetical protein GYB55_14820 [Cytophagales bacterium]|uniref:hypothetical protein n=1 Tax=Cyclobacterium marinum TaxID=104 RepID=UPI0030DCA17A|nr:hypothetical protein [Cytophagales bacterium]|tara:strand:+ start:675 stop:2249 length:1575 start_codon:yes stop_codon:yes gene_type:complete
MKVKFYLAALIFLSLQLELFAQEKTINVDIADPTSRGLLTGTIGVIGTAEDGHFLLRAISKGFSLYGMGVGTKGVLVVEKFNQKYVLEKSRKIEGIPMTLMNKANDKSFEFFYQDVNKDIWLFYSDEFKNNNRLFRKRLDQSTLAFEKPILVSEQAIVNKKLDRRSSYSIVHSEDNSKFAVFSFVGNKSHGKSEAYVEVFDASLNSEWKMNTSIPEYSRDGQETKFYGILKSLNSNGNIRLSNEGVFNMLSKVNVEKGGNEFMHFMYSFYRGIDDPVISYLKNTDKYLLRMSLIQDKNKDVRLAGYYSNDKKLKQIDGLFVQSLNPFTLAIDKQKYIPFSNENKMDFLYQSEDYLSGKEKRKLENGKEMEVPSNTYIKSIFVNEDNSITLASEYYESYTYNGKIYHVNNDFQFTNISQNGEINWIQNFNKQQKDITLNTNGIYQMYESGTIYFIYNEPLEREIRVGQINSKGEVSAKTILKSSKGGELKKFWLIPGTISKVGDNTYLGVAAKFFKERLVKIEIN